MEASTDGEAVNRPTDGNIKINIPTSFLPRVFKAPADRPEINPGDVLYVEFSAPTSERQYTIQMMWNQMDRTKFGMRHADWQLPGMRTQRKVRGEGWKLAGQQDEFAALGCMVHLG